MSDTYHSQSFLRKDGTPDIGKLISTANRCTPSLPGGTAWLDNIRFCHWGPNQWTDGRKHDIEGNARGAAFPWDGASDCRPFTVDGIVNDRVALKTTAFWRAMMKPGAAGDEAGEYSLMLAEHLVWTVLYEQLAREVELSAQYEEHYGWTVLAPRWRREMGLRRAKVTMDMIALESQQAKAQIAQIAQAMQPKPAAPGSQAMTIPTPPQLSADQQKQLLQLRGLAVLPRLIMDPTQEDQAVDWFLNWYDDYIAKSLPEDIRDNAPQVSASTARKVVKELRTKGKSSAPIPYLCKDEPEVFALKPWDEVYLPPELTDAQELVIQAERVTEAELRSRVITGFGSEPYNAEWVEEACKHKGIVSPPTNLPVGVSGQALSTLGGNTSVVPPPQQTGNSEQGLIQILHAVYRATDDDCVPGIYMTTFHRAVNKTKDGRQLYAAHGLADSIKGELPYVANVREWWCRAVTASRSVPEIASTHQNLIKGHLDSGLDRTSITMMPPANIYESPLQTQYKFGPAQKNFVRHGREPQFMQMPQGGGLQEGMEMQEKIKSIIDNYFGTADSDVPQPRQLMKQDMDVRRFLIGWAKALRMLLCLCQKYMKDADFAEITGAPAGWLDQHREDTNVLACQLHFDVRELDPTQFAAQVDAMNKTVIPQDTLGTIDRAKWTRVQTRGINPLWAREILMPADSASQKTFDKARTEVIQMFAGNTPGFVDVKDPTAPSLLKYTMQIVTSNPVYLKALTDEALVAVLGQNAPNVIQRLGKRNPDARFSELLMKWLQNLQFTGVTEPANKQIGRIGVNPQVETGT